MLDNHSATHVLYFVPKQFGTKVVRQLTLVLLRTVISGRRITRRLKSPLVRPIVLLLGGKACQHSHDLLM